VIILKTILIVFEAGVRNHHTASNWTSLRVESVLRCTTYPTYS